jgi:hypothetical protein
MRSVRPCGDRLSETNESRPYHITKEQKVDTPFVIVRPTVGRRVKFAVVDMDGEIGWSDDSGEAALFTSEEQLEEYKKVNKKSFDYDDRGMQRRNYDGVHCRFCYHPTPTMRRTAMEVIKTHARAEYQCSHCNQIETAQYAFDIAVRGALPPLEA